MHKRVKTSENFEYITAVPEKTLRPLHLLEKDQTAQKEVFNRIHSENQTKQLKLTHLKRMIKDLKQNFSKPSERISEPIQSLTQKIQKKEEICERELAEQSALLYKKEKLRNTSDQMRGRLIELQKDFERITSNYSAFNNSNFASKYSLLLSSKALEDFEKHTEEFRNIFKINAEKLEQRLRTASDSNIRQKKRIFSVDFEREEKKKAKREFFTQYERSLYDFKATTQSRQASLSSLASYQKAFSFIRERIHQENPRLQSCYDLDTEVIQKIIQKLKELEYRSESLYLTYEDMSEHEASLTSELNILKKKLLASKNSIETIQSIPIEPIKESQSIKKNYETEVVLIKIYFQTAEILYQALEKLGILKLDKEIEEKLKENLALIKSIRIGTQKRKPFNLERFIIEKFIGKNTYYENRLEVMNSIALSPHELQTIFLKIFTSEQKNSKIFVDFVESSPTIKLFLDRDSLISFLSNNFSKTFPHLLQDLTLSCTLRLLQRTKSLLIETSNFLLVLRKSSPFQSSQFFQFPTQIHKSRSQNTSPYKVTEKYHKKIVENVKQEVKEMDVSKKKVSRVYSLTDAALERQEVMKEVLKNQRKETLLRTIEKKVAKSSEKFVQLPYMKKFVLREMKDG